MSIYLFYGGSTKGFVNFIRSASDIVKEDVGP